MLFGLPFTLGVLGGGRVLYRALGGSGDAIEAALQYSRFVFGGAVLAGFAMTRFVKSSANRDGLMDRTDRSRLRSQSQSATVNTPEQTYIPTGDTIDRSFQGTA